MAQLVMDIPAETSYRAEDYLVSESNRLAYEMIMSWPDWPSYGMWLRGPESSGKTHLAHVWAERSSAVFLQPENAKITADQQVKAYNAFILDENITEFDADWLFHFMNALKGEGKSVLILQTTAPEQMDWPTPDLASRVRALPRMELTCPDDELLHGVTMKMLADRQLRIMPDALDYMLKRIGRSFDELHDFVELLDKKALEHKQKLTLPFIRKCYGQLMDR